MYMCKPQLTVELLPIASRMAESAVKFSPKPLDFSTSWPRIDLSFAIHLFLYRD